jgi:hypothetical protein
MLFILYRLIFLIGILFFGYGFIIALRKRDPKLTLGSLLFIVISGIGVSGLFDAVINESFGITQQSKITTVTNLNETASVDDEESTVDTNSTDTSSPLVSGENGFIANDVYIGIGENKNNFDELMSYVVNDNYEALDQMVLEGKAVLLPKGTPITVVDRGIVKSKINVINTGKRGWVPSEFLSKEIKARVPSY